MKKLIVILPAFIIALAAFYVGHKIRHSAKSSLPIELANKLTATRLFKEFTLLEITANNKYLNKKLTVSGSVKEIRHSSEGVVTVEIEAGNPTFAVSCFFVKSEYKKALLVQKGQEIEVSGICKGIKMNVIMEECKLTTEKLFQF